jgi:hypothetical protein
MKELKDFPGYFITEDGKVFSAWKKKGLGGKDGSFNYIDYNELKELKPDNVKGYHQVTLYNNSKGYKRKVHRLVAETYIENPNNFSDVNHKNEIKNDNKVTNLEWCNNQYNAEYSKCKWIWVVENITTGELFEVINLTKFCRNKNLSCTNLHKTSTGKQKQHKNFRIISKTQFK